MSDIEVLGHKLYVRGDDVSRVEFWAAASGTQMSMTFIGKGHKVLDSDGQRWELNIDKMITQYGVVFAELEARIWNARGRYLGHRSLMCGAGPCIGVTAFTEKILGKDF